MASVIAVTDIIITVERGKAATRDTSAVAPKTRTIKAGTLFVSTGDEEASLREAGAIRDPQKGEKVSVNFEDLPIREDISAPAVPLKSGRGGRKPAEPGSESFGTGTAGDDMGQRSRNDGTAGGEDDNGTNLV